MYFQISCSPHKLKESIKLAPSEEKTATKGTFSVIYIIEERRNCSNDKYVVYNEIKNSYNQVFIRLLQLLKYKSNSQSKLPKLQPYRNIIYDSGSLLLH